MAYRYGSTGFSQPRIGSGYQYGSGDARDPNYFVNPDGLAAARAQRNSTMAAQDALWRQHNANSMAMRDAQAAYEWQQKADRENKLEMNRLGLSPLKEQFGDERSAAYQTVYEDVNGPTGEVSWKTAKDLGAGIQMSVGGLDGSAPAPISASPLVGRRTRRMVRPELQEAYDTWVETGGAGGNPTRSVADLQAIEANKSNEIIERQNNQASLNMQRDRANNLVRGATAAGRILANDDMRTASASDIANDMLTTAGLSMSPQATQAQPTPAAQPSSDGQSQFQKFAIMYRQNYPNATDEQIEQVYINHGGVI